MDRDELLGLLRALEAAAVDYVLIGATAMGLHGVVRATEDVDMLVRAAPENIERLRAALRAAFDGDPEIEGIGTDDLLGEYPAVRYYPPTGDLHLDVMTRLGEAASFESVEAETRDVEGVRVRVATPAALHRLKKGTLRAIDRQDAAALRQRSTCRTSRMSRMASLQRFRSLEEMNAAPVRHGAQDGFERFIRHCARYRALAPRPPRPRPRGVFKFRNLEEAQRARQSSNPRPGQIA